MNDTHRYGIELILSLIPLAIGSSIKTDIIAHFGLIVLGGLMAAYALGGLLKKKEGGKE